MDIFDQLGKTAIGSRLRRLSEQITDSANQVYEMYGVELKPKWFPVYYVLSKGEEKTITAIAEEIGHSHPSVSKIVQEMSKKGFILERQGKEDGRKNIIRLSKKGREVTEKIETAYLDVNTAVNQILSQTEHNLWNAIEEWEQVVKERSYLQRVKDSKKQRESKDVKIEDYQPEYAKAFRELNEEWISYYFKMEKEDYKILDNPEGYIINKGGQVFVAIYDGEPIGMCALVKLNHPEYDFELAKMAVSPKAQGKNIGLLLGQAVIEKARELGASKIYLESNTILKPAINLYYKLGFQKVVTERNSPYERSNIQMELVL